MKFVDHKRTRRWGSIVLAAAGVAIGAVLGEISLRVYASLDESFGRVYRGFDILSAKVEVHGDMGFRPKPNTRWQYSNGTVATTNAQGFRGPTITMPKPRSTFRIVLLGESTTHGWNVSDYETIDAYMRALLEERYRGSSFDVVNLAFDGYDSNQLVERLRTDGLPLSPDLIIVNSGINDVRNAKIPDLQDRDHRTLLWPGVFAAHRDRERLGRHTFFTNIKHVSYLARLPGFVHDVIINTGWERNGSNISPSPAAIEYFERNMERIMGLVRHQRVPILFSSPPSGLSIKFAPHDTSPISYWLQDAKATEEYRVALANRMRSVVTEVVGKNYPTRYVEHNLPAKMFLDDAHLTPEGNRQMARDFVGAAEPYINAYICRDSPAVVNSANKRLR